MAKPTSLPVQATSNAATQAQPVLADLPPPTPEAPPVPPTEVAFPDEALVHLTGVPGTLPEWLL